MHVRFTLWPSTGICLIAILVGLIMCSPSVQAHARLIRTSPVDGASLAASPATVEVVFEEPILLEGSRIWLFDQDEQRVSGTALTIHQHTALSLAIPELQLGAYRAEWEAVSVDSHRVAGIIRFTVGDRAASSIVWWLICISVVLGYSWWAFKERSRPGPSI